MRLYNPTRLYVFQGSSLGEVIICAVRVEQVPYFGKIRTRLFNFANPSSLFLPLWGLILLLVVELGGLGSSASNSLTGTSA
jgi:hypothetical protein